MKNAESFILSGPGHLLARLAQKEAIEVLFLQSPTTLQQLAGPGSPFRSGGVQRTVLLHSWYGSDSGSSCGRGRIPLRAGAARAPAPAGKLIITKTNDGTLRHYAIEWQLKGARYCNATKTASAFLFLYICDDDAISTWRLTDEIIANIAMPVQEIYCRRVVERVSAPRSTPLATIVRDC